VLLLGRKEAYAFAQEAVPETFEFAPAPLPDGVFLLKGRDEPTRWSKFLVATRDLDPCDPPREPEPFVSFSFSDAAKRADGGALPYLFWCWLRVAREFEALVGRKAPSRKRVQKMLMEPFTKESWICGERMSGEADRYAKHVSGSIVRREIQMTNPHHVAAILVSCNDTQNNRSKYWRQIVTVCHDDPALAFRVLESLGRYKIYSWRCHDFVTF